VVLFTLKPNFCFTVRKEALVPVILLFFSLALAVEVGPGTEIQQHENNVKINFSQQLNFSYIDIYPDKTDFEGSNFTVEPENEADLTMDFYESQANLQEFVSNFSATAPSQQEVNFSVGNLPSDLFYEAFNPDTDERFFIGYTDQNDNFNFSFDSSSEEVAVLNYGKKGVGVTNVDFNDTDPVEDRDIKAQYVLENIGKIESENPNVTMDVDTYNGTQWVDQSFESKDEIIVKDSAEQRDFIWTPEPGPFRFDITADPNDNIKETDETDNTATDLLDVSSYQTFYGGTDLTLRLGAQDDDLRVFNQQIAKGNLHFADTDADIAFSNLEPVTSNFQEADNALNMRGHNDSIQKEFNPDNNKTFNIAGEQKTAPVINSSSNGNFKTGIFYDASEGTPFDGSQSLVFVSEIQDSTEGEYGIYDYEARIPALLREQEGSNDMIDIYAEIE
jgi:hypothetical protein